MSQKIIGSGSIFGFGFGSTVKVTVTSVEHSNSEETLPITVCGVEVFWNIVGSRIGSPDAVNHLTVRPRTPPVINISFSVRSNVAVGGFGATSSSQASIVNGPKFGGTGSTINVRVTISKQPSAPYGFGGIILFAFPTTNM